MLRSTNRCASVGRGPVTDDDRRDRTAPVPHRRGIRGAHRAHSVFRNGLLGVARRRSEREGTPCRRPTEFSAPIPPPSAVWQRSAQRSCRACGPTATHVGVVRHRRHRRVCSVTRGPPPMGARAGTAAPRPPPAALNGYDVVDRPARVRHLPRPRRRRTCSTVVRAVTRPVITVLHTVLVTPSLRQKAILDELVLLSDARRDDDPDRKGAADPELSIVDPRKVRVIPHGAVDSHDPEARRPRPRRERRPDHPDVGPAGRGQGHRVGHLAQWHSCGTSIRPRGTTWWARPTRRSSNATGRCIADGLEAQVRDLGVDDAVAFDARYLETTRAAAAWCKRPMSSCCPTTPESR